MMEAARTSETLVNFYQTTRCYNPEDSHLHILYFSQNIIRVIISERMRLAGYVACSGEMKNAYKILFRKLKRREYLGDLGIDEINRV
jgi:hypothetical protein